MGYRPHDVEAALSLRLQIMKTTTPKITRTFGEFVTSVYDICDKREAAKIVQLAIKAHLIEFHGRQRFAIS
jgi:hypothetical protein